MTQKTNILLPQKTPIMFSDGTKIFKRFAKEYICHKKGFFIMAPSGVGKTHYVNNQKEKHWIDGDVIWEATNAHPRGSWWLKPNEYIDFLDQRSDIITAQAKKLGLWIMGASNYWLTPDAIVIPDWKTHVSYIKNREQNNYDGGATLDRLDQVKGHRKWILQWVKKGVPRFNSIDDATNYLFKIYKRK